MHGNVYEWCMDTFQRDYYEKSPARNPGGPEKGRGKCVRGGCWLNGAEWCRSASRNWCDNNDASDIVGFRVLCQIVQKK
jgi:formylglycine-generating enzyme required for sulfatase activity